MTNPTNTETRHTGGLLTVGVVELDSDGYAECGTNLPPQLGLWVNGSRWSKVADTVLIREPDAQRLVDCWNACASIPGDPGEGVRKAIDALELCEIVLDYSVTASLFGKDLSDALALDHVKAALSALKGEGGRERA